MTNILVFFSYSKTLLILGLIFLLNIEKIHCDIGVGGRRGRVEAADASTTKVFDITTYGAKGDDKTDCTMVSFDCIIHYLMTKFFLITNL